jgi:ribosomal protein S8
LILIWMKSRYQSDGNVFSSPFVSVSITIDKLYALIIDDGFVAFEQSICLTPFEKWCRYRQTIRYCQSINKTNVIPHAYPVRRKNLSLSDRTEGLKAVCYVVGVLILMAIDAVMSYFMNW